MTYPAWSCTWPDPATSTSLLSALGPFWRANPESNQGLPRGKKDLLPSGAFEFLWGQALGGWEGYDKSC